MRASPAPAHVLRRAGLLVGACALAALVVPVSGAAAAVISSNWAGYVARTATGRGFRSVSSSWTAPPASCRAGRETHSAVWVGLGGYRERSGALEQIGTNADCTTSGHASYSSWVELLPAAAVSLPVKVSPGDRITASVTVIGRDATLRLRNLTTGRRYSGTRRLRSADVSTADWVLEAPSGCDGAGHCSTLALTDFGSVAFDSASATAGGHTGTITDPAWRATRLLLRQAGAGASGAGALRTLVSATPSALDGSSFSVGYGETAGGQAPGAATLPG